MVRPVVRPRRSPKVFVLHLSGHGRPEVSTLTTGPTTEVLCTTPVRRQSPIDRGVERKEQFRVKVKRSLEGPKVSPPETRRPYRGSSLICRSRPLSPCEVSVCVFLSYVPASPCIRHTPHTPNSLPPSTVSHTGSRSSLSHPWLLLEPSDPPEDLSVTTRDGR